MGQCIRKFSDGSSLEYDNGSFDCWCVYIIKPDGRVKSCSDPVHKKCSYSANT